MKMSWLITSPKGQLITINFDSHFGTRNADDYVGIYDGASTSDSEIGKYYGTAGPVGNITSSSNGNLLVIFTSNSRDTSFGFSATFYFEGKSIVVTSYGLGTFRYTPVLMSPKTTARLEFTASVKQRGMRADFKRAVIARDTSRLMFAITQITAFDFLLVLIFLVCV